MRWWLHTDPPCIMSVDNSSVKGMDFSELIINDPDLWMVQWTEGKGEIERQIVVNGGVDDLNLNGLREDFYDITPYVPLFQQFLTRIQSKNLLLDQAKKIQIDLIKQLYESKRQLPYHYPVAAGDYWWDASDDTMGAGTASGTQNVTTFVNQIAVALNQLVDNINALVVGGVNAQFNTINHGISDIGNTLVSHVNTQVVNYANSALSTINSIFGQVNTSVADAGNTLIDYLNLTWTDGANSVQSGLAKITIPAPDGGSYYVAQGISGAVAYTPYGHMFSDVGSNPYQVQYVAPGTFNYVSAISGVPWTALGNVGVSNAQWIPIGSTTPVNVTPEEQVAILNGIAARTNQLNAVKNSKIAEVNALTYVGAVIAYDVLAGWPVIDVPPGFKLEAPMHAASSVTVVGQPIVTSGVPEAPSDNVTYGRRNMIWNPALALSNDVLDGGNF